MEKIVQNLCEIHNQIQDYKYLLNFKENSDDIRLIGLEFIRKQVIITLELMNFYFKIWKRNELFSNIRIDQLSIIEKNQLKFGNAERVNYATRSLYVFSFSTFDYCIKECGKQFSNLPASLEVMKKVNQKKFPSINLYDIIKGSSIIFSEEESNTFNKLRKIRNWMVNNNSIAEEIPKIISIGNQITFIQLKVQITRSRFIH